MREHLDGQIVCVCVCDSVLPVASPSCVLFCFVLLCFVLCLFCVVLSPGAKSRSQVPEPCLPEPCLPEPWLRDLAPGRGSETHLKVTKDFKCVPEPMCVFYKFQNRQRRNTFSKVLVGVCFQIRFTISKTGNDETQFQKFSSVCVSKFVLQCSKQAGKSGKSTGKKTVDLC